MAVTPSTMLPLGTPAPDFSLRDAVSGRMVTLDDAARDAKALLVMFICNHCPYVVHVRSAFGPLARDYAAAGLSVVAVNSNSAESHPQDGPKHMAELATELSWPFAFLFDADQSVARAYAAACTPDFFLFGPDRRLAYRGELDGSRPGKAIPVTGAALRAAIDAVLAGRPAPSPQRPSIGCNIKWKPGNEPSYFG